ncbi:hypothetical protein Nmel_004641 [Mimus melanotis]
MVIRVFVASSSGSVAVSGGEGGEQGGERGRRGQGSACGAGDCRGWQLVLPALPSPSSAPSLVPARRHRPQSVRGLPWDVALNLPRLRVRWGRKRQLSSAGLPKLN